MSAGKILKIGTHNGTFHCDEVLACFMLKQLAEYKNASVVRTRDEEKLNNCDIVVDVGAIYEPEKKRFDHHQRSFGESMNSLNAGFKWTTKLSSAGLVYFHYGHRIVSEMLNMSTECKDLKKIYAKVYENFIEEVDAIDNGVEHCASEPRYHISTHLSARISRLNPAWNEENYNEDKLFEKAMTVAGEEFSDRVNWYGKSWLSARDIVLDAVNKRSEVDPSGEIIVFEKGGCPWKDHIYEIEEEMALSKNIKFVIYQDQSGSWRVQCVNIRLGSFHSRVPLLEVWRGMRNEALATLIGRDDAVFVHASGFIGGAKSRDTVLLMAKRTLEQV